MSRINDRDNQFKDSIKLCEKSISLIPQIKKWCSNIKIESEYGGMIGEMGLPTMNTISCTQFRGDSAMNLEWIAHDFIVGNCPDCKFHNEININNYGRNVLRQYEEGKRRKEKEKLEELEIISQLEQRLVDILKKKDTVKTAEASILKLLVSLKDSSSNTKRKANEIFESSKLSPAFFNSLSLDFLSIYFKDERINEVLLSTCQNIIIYDEKVVSNYFLGKVISLIETERNANDFLKTIPFNALEIEQVINISPHLIEKYDLSSFDRINHFENHSPSIISFFENLYSLYNEVFFRFIKSSLKNSDSNFRANAVLILNQLFVINSNIVIPLIRDMIKSLDIEDSDYPKSADYIISKTFVNIAKLKGEDVFNVINEEFEQLTVGGKIEILRFYEIFANDSIENPKSLYTQNITNQLIKICLDKNPPKLKEKAIDILENFSKKNLEVLFKNFDSFIGVLTSSVIAKSTFEWYKKDLDKNTLTFNPLTGKHFQEIMLEETILDSEIRKLKGILKNLLKHNQVQLYEKLIDIIRNIDEGDTNSTQLKLFLIEIIRDGIEDSILLTNVLPDIHNWLLDFKNIPLRTQAFRFLEKLLSNNFQIVPQTIFSLLEIFVEDNNDNLIKKYAILCYKQILIDGRSLSKKEIIILLDLFKSQYIIIHKTATELTYRLFDLLDNSERATLLTYLIRLLENHHNEKERDYDFCEKLFKQSMYVSKEINPNHFDKTEKILIEKYLAEYCQNGDYYARLNSLNELSSFRERNSYYNDLWLEQSLSFIYNTNPNRFESFINSDRGNLYEKVLSLSLDNLLPFKESIKENILRRCLSNIELFYADLRFTLIIFSFFNLNRDVIEVANFIKDNFPKTQALDYFFNKIDEFLRLSHLALIYERSLSPTEVKELIANNEVSESEIIALQETITKRRYTLFNEFKIKNIDNVLREKEILSIEYEKLVNFSSNSKEEDFFYSLKSLFNAIILLLEWSKEVMQGNTNSFDKLSGSKSNVKLVDVNSFKHIPPLKEQVQKINESIKVIKEFSPDMVVDLIKCYAQLKIPYIYHLRKNKNMTYTHNIYEKKEENSKVHILSLELYLGENPWANPQILKSKEIYVIKGIIKLNQIPAGYKFLKIQPSTTNSNIFDLNIEEIELIENELQYEINGTILFRYALNSLEELISIKLIPFFLGKNDKICPVIIGYDELITKVLDEKNDFFQTGFKMMNKKVFELYNDPLIQQLDDDEKNNFFTILNGIINYQGYCLQSGAYKGVRNCRENNFRDVLIQYLSANPQIGENISKEAHIAGGRVEITFKGIVTELKVETKMSERDRIIKKYANQPLAYSSGNSKLASIVCILDLTEKKSPSSPAINNIILNTMKTHGFQKQDSEFNPFQVFIFIDGNTKNPSDYSK